MELSEETKGILMLAARDSIQSLFSEKRPPVIDYTYYPDLLKQGFGVFVTIIVDNQLRGCIGYITSSMSLFDTVCDSAIQAASNDPRFFPIAEEELPHVNIEISVLSPLMDITSYDQIQIGQHGLVLEDEYYRAVLLPQVAIENKYDVEQFLTALCEKAGIQPYSWKTDNLNIKVFTASIFSELGSRRRTYEQS
ncbi:MAG: AmmeMemoRadiSam system protein A [Bacteroidetes bacterium]|nr:AmmeMemoRadiSam system protein A [Bacteroidota bacterium]